MLLYVMLYLTLRKEKTRMWYLVSAIPLVLNALLAFSVFFTDIAYSYSEDNHYSRGPIGMCFYYILIFYMILIVIGLIRQRKESSRLRQIVGYACLLLGLAAMGIELQGWSEGIVRTSICLVFVFYYMYYQSTEYTKEQRQTTYIANHDALTGVYNRYAFDDITEKFKTTDKPTAFAMIDIDYFKQINDTYGHDVGDRALKRVAELLNVAFRSSDYIFRLGGDEFAVLMPSMKPERAAFIRERIAQMNKDLQNPRLEDMPKMTVSVGVAFSRMGVDQALYKRADEALYKVKQSTRGDIAFHDEV